MLTVVAYFNFYVTTISHFRPQQICIVDVTPPLSPHTQKYKTFLRVNLVIL